MSNSTERLITNHLSSETKFCFSKQNKNWSPFLLLLDTNKSTDICSVFQLFAVSTLSSWMEQSVTRMIWIFEGVRAHCDRLVFWVHCQPFWQFQGCKACGAKLFQLVASTGRFCHMMCLVVMSPCWLVESTVDHMGAGFQNVWCSNQICHQDDKILKGVEVLLCSSFEAVCIDCFLCSFCSVKDQLSYCS